MRVEWSDDALADLDRFAEFLKEHHPRLAPRVAGEIVAKTRLLSEHPTSGRSLGASPAYREIALSVLNAIYVFQYHFDGRRVLVLRVFHGREERK